VRPADLGASTSVATDVGDLGEQQQQQLRTVPLRTAARLHQGKHRPYSPQAVEEVCGSAADGGDGGPKQWQLLWQQGGEAANEEATYRPPTTKAEADQAGARSAARDGKAPLEEEGHVEKAPRVAIVPSESAQRESSLADWWGSESERSNRGSVEEFCSCLAFDAAAAKMLPPFPIKGKQRQWRMLPPALLAFGRR
jgi:hypothetical protein